jgi:hypothetical protein
MRLIELGAMLGTGQGGELGYTRERSANLFRSCPLYGDGLSEAHGPEAGTLLKLAKPQVRKALGIDYFRARWKGNVGRGKALDQKRGHRKER